MNMELLTREDFYIEDETCCLVYNGNYTYRVEEHDSFFYLSVDTADYAGPVHTFGDKFDTWDEAMMKIEEFEQ